MEEEKDEYRIYRKIEPNRKVRVFKSTFNEKTFYKIQIKQKNYDETEDIWYENVVFKHGVELDDPDGKGIDIKIKKAYENCRKNPIDKYNPIFYLMITDFELVERDEQKKAAALEKFNDNLNEVENEELPF
jgi:hypothetical protein